MIDSGTQIATMKSALYHDMPSLLKLTVGSINWDQGTISCKACLAEKNTAADDNVYNFEK